MIAAISSMRLFVVAGSLPDISFSLVPYRRITPQPPGPGLPLHAPSVKISTTGRPLAPGFLVPGPLVSCSSPTAGHASGGELAVPGWMRRPASAGWPARGHRLGDQFRDQGGLLQVGLMGEAGQHLMLAARQPAGEL